MVGCFNRLGIVCRTDSDTGKVRDQKDRFRHCDSNQNDCCSGFFVGNGIHRWLRRQDYINTPTVFTVFAATGASLICYFKALSIGDVNKVVPIDKSSTVLSVLLAIVLFHETEHLAVKLISTVLLGVGIILMVEKKKSDQKASGNTYILYAIGSAVFAALTSILAKVGITGVESNLGTAIRTIVVLVMAWLLVLIKKKAPELKHLDKKELGFIGLSGIATGASWLCYYYAIQNGIVSVVVPIDKMSLLVTVIFSYLAFHERLSKKALVGLVLMLAGTLAMAVFS